MWKKWNVSTIISEIEDCQKTTLHDRYRMNIIKECRMNVMKECQRRHWNTNLHGKEVEDNWRCVGRITATRKFRHKAVECNPASFMVKVMLKAWDGLGDV